MKNISWDIDKKTSNITLSNNNLTGEKKDGGYEGVLATISKNTGKWYWEVSIDKCDESKYYSTDMLVGVCEESQLLSGFNDSRGFTNVRMIYDFGDKISKNNYTKYGSNFKMGDIVSILLDLNNGSIEFWINGKSQGIAFDDLKDKTWFPCVFAYYDFKWTINFGRTSFKYEVPDDYMNFEKIKKYLIKENNQYYTLKSSFYSIGSEVNKEIFKKYGVNNLVALTSKIDKGKLIMNNVGDLENGKQFSVSLKNEIKTIR